MPIRYVADFLLALVVLTAAHSTEAAVWSADPVTRFVVTQEGETVHIQAEADLPARSSSAWAVLTDYEGYPNFISSMSSSRLVSRGADGLVVAQRGRFSFLFFSRDIKVRKRVQESPPNIVDSEAIDGDFQLLTERYALSQHGPRLRLSYTGHLITKFELPSFFGLSVLRHVLQRNFREMLDEIQRREALADPLAPTVSAPVSTPHPALAE